MENKYCVYRHLKPCGEVFYIGIGSVKRPYSKKNRNKYWKNVVNKYGYEIEILTHNKSWEECIEVEKILISWYKRKDCCGGTLVNMTDGGEGCTGRMWTNEQKDKISKANTGKTHTEEQKQKWSENRSGENHCQFGKPLSESRKNNISKAKKGKKATEETKAIMSLSHKGKHIGCKNGMFGVKHSEEFKERQSKAIKLYYQNNPHKGCRKVINTLTLEIFSSIKEVCEKNNLVYNTLAGKLAGHDKNNTVFIYLNVFIENLNRSEHTVDSSVDSWIKNKIKVEVDDTNN